MSELSRGTAGFIVQDGPDGKPYLAFVAGEGNINVHIALATHDVIDEFTAGLIRSLKEAAADIKRQASGLVVAREVPNGFSGRPAQGRQQQRPRRSG